MMTFDPCRRLRFFRGLILVDPNEIKPEIGELRHSFASVRANVPRFFQTSEFPYYPGVPGRSGETGAHPSKNVRSFARSASSPSSGLPSFRMISPCRSVGIAP